MFNLVHLTDVHLPPLPKPHFSELLNKRALGYLNWRRKRIGIHKREILDALVKNVKAVNPDHIAVTGDLTNIGLLKEFRLAREWIETLGTPDKVTVIPGNHDAYLNTSIKKGWPLFLDYMKNDAPQPESKTSVTFPFVKLRGKIALIGLSSAIKTPPFVASGALGNKQLQALAEHLNDLGKYGFFRIVLIHHPPVAGTTRRIRALKDDAEMENTLVEHGAELVLYGHNHKWRSQQLTGTHGITHIIQAPSASQMATHIYPTSGYNHFQIEQNGPNWSATHNQYELDAATGEMKQLSSQKLEF